MSLLLDQQNSLQAAADQLVAVLQFDAMLARIGRPVRVGSSAMGLMVRRDIDITVTCPDLGATTLAAFAQIGADLMQRTDCVSAVRFRNDSGPWNADPAAYPDGLYLGLTVRDAQGDDWTFDIWAVDQPARQPDLRHLETLLPRLNHGNRETILTIKQAVLGWPVDRRVPSAWVYDAVVDDGIADAAQFEAWLHRTGKVAW